MLMHIPMHEVNDAVTVHMHHSEAVDPTLASWINDLMHDLLGWGPWTFVVVFGLVILLIPLWLIYDALRNPEMQDDAESESD